MRHLRMTLDDGKKLTISGDGGYCKIGIELPGQGHMSALLEACESAETCIHEYLSGEWDGNVEGWDAMIEHLHAAALAVKNVSKGIT